MRIISTLLFCALLLGFNSCLEEASFDSIENAVDVADCNMYGVMNDSLWCGTTDLAFINNDTISVRFNKNGPLVNGYAAESIFFKLVFIADKGTYFLENGDLSILQ